MKAASAKKPQELLCEASADLKRQFPSMSLRAVASKLDISPSYWSKILRGKKPLTKTLVPRVVKVLGLDTQQVALLQRSILANLEAATGITVNNESSPSPIENYANKGRDAFWLLESWYHIPILNLFTLSNFAPTAQNIADFLGIRVDQADATINLLLQSGFLQTDENGKLVRSELLIRFPTKKSHASIRAHHKAMIQKSLQELMQEPSELRFQSRLISSVCFSGSAERFKEAQLILEEAMYRAANLMLDAEPCNEVYQLNLQFFPLRRQPKSSK